MMTAKEKVLFKQLFEKENYYEAYRLIAPYIDEDGYYLHKITEENMGTTVYQLYPIEDMLGQLNDCNGFVLVNIMAEAYSDENENLKAQYLNDFSMMAFTKFGIDKNAVVEQDFDLGCQLDNDLDDELDDDLEI